MWTACRGKEAERRPDVTGQLSRQAVWLLLHWRGPRAARSIANKTGSKEAANHLRGGAAAPSRRAPPRRRRPMARHCRDHRHRHTADTVAWKVASPGVATVIRARRVSREPGDDRGATSVLSRPGPVTEVSGRGIVGPGPGADRRRKEATRLAAPSDVAAAGSELIDDDRHTLPARRKDTPSRKILRIGRELNKKSPAAPPSPSSSLSGRVAPSAGRRPNQKATRPHGGDNADTGTAARPSRGGRRRPHRAALIVSPARTQLRSKQPLEEPAESPPLTEGNGRTTTELSLKIIKYEKSYVNTAIEHTLRADPRRKNNGGRFLSAKQHPPHTRRRHKVCSATRLRS